MRRIGLLIGFAALCWAATVSAQESDDCVLFETSYGERLAESTNDVALWWASSGWKVSKDRPVPRKRGRAVHISAARNEAEAAQLVVTPRSTMSGFIAEAGPLSGPDGATLAAENVEVLRVRYVNIEHPTHRAGAVAPWPDPLPPFKGPIAIAAGENQPLWVRVFVPRDAAPGRYEGSISLTADGYRAQVPLHVTVYDFALPDTMSCSTAFGFSAETVYTYHNLTEPEHRREVLDKYLDNFAAHHISLYDPVPGHSFGVEWVKIGPDEGADLHPGDRALLQSKALTPRFDWADWDAAMERAIAERHITSFRIPVVGMGGGTYMGHREPELHGYTVDDREYHLAFTAYAQAVEAHLREKGWLDLAYVYWFDEPNPTQYDFVRTQNQRLKAAAPGLRRMLTEQVEPALIGGPNLWCPLPWTYNHERAEARRAEGEIFWWYVCTTPKTPYPGLFIDHPGTDLRVWLWQTWKYNMVGILIWHTNLWSTSPAYVDHPQNPYEDPMSWKNMGTAGGRIEAWGNGDGRFVYPPEEAAGVAEQPVLDGPVDCIRHEMLRDGIEDYEYHVILKGLLDAKGSGLPQRRLQRYERLLEVPVAITADVKTYTRDPAPIERQRDRIARAIEELSRR